MNKNSFFLARSPGFVVPLICAIILFALRPAVLAMDLPKVPPADLSNLKPSDFDDDELDLPYYLAHFHRLANSVVAEGVNRGFIDISIWRHKKDNRSYNARIMENCLSLAFFYCTKRPWNLYYGHPSVRKRLELALDFWCRMQNEDGLFSEYGPGKWNLAATAFATKYMGQALTLIHDGPPVDADLHKRVIEADRKTIRAVLTKGSLYDAGKKKYSNQHSNVWAGAFVFLKLYPDPEIEKLLLGRLKQSTEDFQSPAGYFYESDGPDWGYNLGTHHSNLHMTWHYARGTDLGKLFIEKVSRWYEWLSYNAVREPDGSGYTVNRAIETRFRNIFLGDRSVPLGGEGDLMIYQRGFGSPLAREVEIARAFSTTRRTLQEKIAVARTELEKNWPKVKPLVVGNFSAFSPYAFLHRSHVRWYPTDEQQAAAITKLPYLARERFIHQRVDSHRHIAYTYVRRSSYYATLISGERIQSQPCCMLGLVWNHKAGSLLQSQTGTRNAAWGTMTKGKKFVYEDSTVKANIFIDGKAILPKSGNRDLPDGVLVISYALGKQGQKTVTFAEDHIAVDIRHEGGFTEYIPMLKGYSDELDIRQGEVRLRRASAGLTITFDKSAKVRTIETKYDSGLRRVVTVCIDSNDTLGYRLIFHQDTAAGK